MRVGNTHRGGLGNVSMGFPLGMVAMIAKIDNSKGDALMHSIFCGTLGHRCDRTDRQPNRFVSLRKSMRLIGSVRFMSRGPVKGSSHDGPMACMGTCSRVQGLFTRRPLTGRVKCATKCFSFGARNKHYRRYGNSNAMAIRVRFVTSLMLRYRSYRKGHFGDSALRVGFRSGDVCSVLRVAIGRTVRFFTRCGRGGVIGGLVPLRRIKLKCVGLKRTSSALSNNRGRHMGLTCFLDVRGTRPAVFMFSRPAANLRFRSVGGLLRTFRTLVDHKRAVVVVRRGVSIVGYTSRIVSLKPRKKGVKKGLMITNAPRRITTYTTSCAKRFLHRGLTVSSPS